MVFNWHDEQTRLYKMAIISAAFWWKTKANHHMNPKVTHFQQVLLIHLSVLLLIFWWRNVQNTEFEVNNRTLLESKIYDRIHWKFFFFLRGNHFSNSCNTKLQILAAWSYIVVFLPGKEQYCHELCPTFSLPFGQ